MSTSNSYFDDLADLSVKDILTSSELIEAAITELMEGEQFYDLLFDPLTFTIATGNEDDRKLALWTLDAIEEIRAEFPELQIILGLSNVSFGLNAAARHVLNSVMLDHAMRPLFGYLRAVVVPTAVFAATEDFGGDADLERRVHRAAGELAALVVAERTGVAGFAPTGDEASGPLGPVTDFSQLLRGHDGS